MIFCDLCKSHKPKSLYVFYSVLTDKINTESEVDLLVEKQLKTLFFRKTINQKSN